MQILISRHLCDESPDPNFALLDPSQRFSAKDKGTTMNELNALHLAQVVKFLKIRTCAEKNRFSNPHLLAPRSILVWRFVATLLLTPDITLDDRG